MADDLPEGVTMKTEQEMVKACKRNFESWREILLHVNSVLEWEQPFYPGVIAGVVSFIFMMLWYFDPSVLSTISIFCIIISILDYAVPIISASIFDANKWSGSKEKKYEEVCHGMVNCYLKFCSICSLIKRVKENKPYMYFFGVLTYLIMMAWIGNLINNLFLTYLTVMFWCMMPGLKKQPLVRDNLAKVLSMISGVIDPDKKKK